MADGSNDDGNDLDSGDGIVPDDLGCCSGNDDAKCIIGSAGSCFSCCCCCCCCCCCSAGAGVGAGGGATNGDAITGNDDGTAAAADAGFMIVYV